MKVNIFNYAFGLLLCLDYEKDTSTVAGKDKIANTIMKSFNNSIFFSESLFNPEDYSF